MRQNIYEKNASLVKGRIFYIVYALPFIVGGRVLSALIKKEVENLDAVCYNETEENIG